VYNTIYIYIDRFLYNHKSIYNGEDLKMNIYIYIYIGIRWQQIIDFTRFFKRKTLFSFN